MTAYAPHRYAEFVQFILQLKVLMITNIMPILWIIINPLHLYCPFIMRLAKIVLDLRSDIGLVLACKTVTMNIMAVIKVFYIICKAVLLSLFTCKHLNRGLLGPRFTCFGMVKIDGYNIFYLHCFVWLTKVSYLPILYTKTQENKVFCMRLLAFLEYIIKCFVKNKAFLMFCITVVLMRVKQIL